MSNALDLSAKRLIDDALWLSETATEEDQRKQKNYSLRKALVQDVVQAAQYYSGQIGCDDEEFENLASKGVSLVDDLQYSLVAQSSHTPADWNFWHHERYPIERIGKDQRPYMARESIESLVSSYLELPYRVPFLERTLVDILPASSNPCIVKLFHQHILERPDTNRSWLFIYSLRWGAGWRECRKLGGWNFNRAFRYFVSPRNNLPSV